jgi:hypothetical protein
VSWLTLRQPSESNAFTTVCKYLEVRIEGVADYDGPVGYEVPQHTLYVLQRCRYLQQNTSPIITSAW